MLRWSPELSSITEELDVLWTKEHREVAFPDEESSTLSRGALLNHLGCLGASD